MLVIGIDPASDGSACIMRETNVLMSLAWSRKIRTKNKVKYAVYDCNVSILGNDEKQHFQCKSGPDIGAQIGAYLTMLKHDDDEPFLIACEDAYIGINKATGLIVAKFAGMIVGAVHCFARAEQRVVWVKPNTWRLQVIRLKPGTKREQCKAASLRYIPMKAQTANEHLDKLGQLDHITDAIGVALYAHQQAQNL